MDLCSAAMSTLMSISNVRLYLGSELYWRSIGSELLGAVRCGVGARLFTDRKFFHRFGFVSHADLWEGVRRFPNFFVKTAKFRVKRVQVQQTKTEAKTKVNNRNGGTKKEGAMVVDLENST